MRTLPMLVGGGMSRLVVSLLLFLTLGAGARAQGWSTDPQTPAGWAWKQIQAGQFADFNDHCGKTLDALKPDGWKDPCRQIPAQFLIDILVNPKWKGQVDRHGVRLLGVHIGDDIDLSDADIEPEVWLHVSRIDGNVYLNDSHLKRLFSLYGSFVGKSFVAYRVNAESDLLLRSGAYFADDVSLVGARIGGALDVNSAHFAKTLTLNSADIRGNLLMDSGIFDGPVNANSASVHGNLFMRSNARFGGPVDLVVAKVDGNLEMETATFTQRLTANSLSVKGSLFMREHAVFDAGADLTNATVEGDAVMEGSFFRGELTANSLNVLGTLNMGDHAAFAGDVILIGAKIGRGVDMDASVFSRSMNADSATIQGGLFMRDGAFFGGNIVLVAAKVGLLQLRSATVSSIDMSDLAGSAGSELELTGLTWRCTPNLSMPVPKDTTPRQPYTWPLGDPAWRTFDQCNGPGQSAPRLVLRNVRVESFQDTADSWPPSLDLEGFHYDRLGGLNGSGRFDMRQRTPEEWIDWLQRDSTFSPQPYAQLASVLSAAGRRETAESILYAGNDTERNEVWNRPDVWSWRWFWHDFWTWAWRSVFAGVAGYGVGMYTFRVLWWVIILTAAGWAALWFSPYARDRSPGWRLGASLHRLLPIVELNKEFKDFFDNTDEPGKPVKLHRWQMAFFSFMALAGWVLGFFLLAAMGVLTGK